MAKYVKKPVVVEAIQYLEGVNDKDVINFTEQKAYYTKQHGLVIPTLEGDHAVSNGDYVIRGVKGEFYPCKSDIFKLTYSPIEEI